MILSDHVPAAARLVLDVEAVFILINATIDFRRKDSDPKKIDEGTYYARLKARTPYRVMGKGRPEEDGSFRFYYPNLDPKKHAYIDHATGLELKRPVLQQRTLTVSPDIPEHLPIIKQLQMFELRSDDWEKWYGLRNRVEENNYWLKHDGFTDLGNPEKRRARGYAYQTLTAGVAAAVSNMRRIVSFIANAAVKAFGETELRTDVATTSTTTQYRTSSSGTRPNRIRNRTGPQGPTRVGAGAEDQDPTARTAQETTKPAGDLVSCRFRFE